MKRPLDDDPAFPVAAVIRLNVGSVRYDTTSDTLGKCRFFEPFLEGRVQFARDNDGRIFIDRDGEWSAIS